MVIVDVPEPGAASEAELKVTVTPVGSPAADSAIAELKPPDTVVVMAETPLPPCATETEAGEADMLKWGVVEIAASVVIRPVPFGLPQPVTRS